MTEQATCLRTLGENARNLRLKGDFEAYLVAATTMLNTLESFDILPCPADRIEVLSGGRVNYITGKATLDGHQVFIKICPPGIEDAFYRAALEGQIRINGSHFLVPACYAMNDDHGVSVFALQYFGTMSNIESATEDSIRVKGLGEFSHLNRKAERIQNNLPAHRLIIRESSVARMKSSLKLEDNSPEIETHKTIIKNWKPIEQRLRASRFSLCVRDSSRDNVVVADNKAILCDTGAVHYAPIGFDLWSFAAKSDNVCSSAIDYASIFQASMRDTDQAVDVDDLQFVTCAAACIMCLDTFVGNSYYGNHSMVAKLHKVALSLIDSEVGTVKFL
jgi:hypothetical protein